MKRAATKGPAVHINRNKKSRTSSTYPTPLSQSGTTWSVGQPTFAPVSILPAGCTAPAGQSDMVAASANAPQVTDITKSTEPFPQLRTIYLGNVPKETKATEILDYVKSGLIEAVTIRPEKGCAFIKFIEPSGAQLFYQEFLVKQMMLHNVAVVIGWGKPSTLPHNIHYAIQHGATRTVFLGNLDGTVTAASIETELKKFGPIDLVTHLKEKNIAFVHYVNIVSAIACTTCLPFEEAWSSRRVNYGKDRCNQYVALPQLSTTSMQEITAQAIHPATNTTGTNTVETNIPDTIAIGTSMAGSTSVASNFTQHAVPAITPIPTSSTSQTIHATSMVPIAPTVAVTPTTEATTSTVQHHTKPSNTIYIGGIQADATCNDLCNVIRGGPVYEIRYIADKHIAFVTFTEQAHAVVALNYMSTRQLLIRGKRIRVGWANDSTLQSIVLIAAQQGASRNVYLGGVPDNLDVEALRTYCSNFGEVELVNTLKEKSCAFVNFASIVSAIKAHNQMSANGPYSSYRIRYGKDRCARPPKEKTTFKFKATGKAAQKAQHVQETQDVQEAQDV